MIYRAEQWATKDQYNNEKCDYRENPFWHRRSVMHYSVYIIHIAITRNQHIRSSELVPLKQVLKGGAPLGRFVSQEAKGRVDIQTYITIMELTVA